MRYAENQHAFTSQMLTSPADFIDMALTAFAFDLFLSPELCHDLAAA
jgi:hypothetical protein